jgi:hypothetical protein
MTGTEIYEVIDDPQQQYKKHQIAECFAELAQLNDKYRSEYRLETIAFTLSFDEKYNLAGVTASAIDLIKQPAAKTYFEQRLSLTRHPETIARYGHLLWQLHRYYKGYQAAVTAYLQIAEYALNKLDSTERYFGRWRRTICPALILSAATNDRPSFEKATILVNRLIHQLVPIWMKSMTVDNILEHLKNKASVFDLEIYIGEVLRQNGQQGYFRPKEDYETAIKADSLYGSTHKLLLWEKMADGIRSYALSRTNDPGRIATMPQLAEAMEYYKKAKADAKYLETAQEYQLLKRTRKVNQVSIDLIDENTGRILHAYIENRKNYYLAMNVGDILIRLATDLDLLPGDGGDNESGPYGQLAGQITLVNFDINQNPKILSEAGSHRLGKAWNYKLKYKIFTQQYISGIMHELISKGELSIEILDAFFNKTWIGKTTLASSSGQAEDECNLYMTIRPALIYYIEQAGRSLRGEEADFMLCTDTLVLKYEMLIRSFLQHRGVATTVIDSQSGDPRENYLPELLDKLPEDSFDDKDKQLMRHIYTKSGTDLRNNIAHSYLGPKSYTLELADTVVWSIIRLGQYTTAPDQPEAEL